jgi:hypothetical protein
MGRITSRDRTPAPYQPRSFHPKDQGIEDFGYEQFYTFIASGDWVCPPNVYWIRVRLAGGGGGGGDGTTTTRSGGGGGGFAMGIYRSVPGTTYTATVGAGGTMGTSGGGTTSFGVKGETPVIQATGGALGFVPVRRLPVNAAPRMA